MTQKNAERLIGPSATRLKRLTDSSATAIAVLGVALLQALSLGSPNPSALLAAACVTVPFAVFTLPRANPALRRTITLGAAAALATVIAAEPSARGEFSTLLRGGQFRIPILATAVFWTTQGRQTRLWTAIAGTSIGMLGFGLYAGAALTSVDLWKYYIAYPATILFLLAISAIRIAPRAQVALTVAWACMSFALDFRSQAAICVATCFYWLLVTRSGLGRLRRRAVVITALVGIGLATYLPSLALDGTFGATIQQKFYENSLVGTNPLFSGRPEVAISLAAWSMRPVWGWGVVPDISHAMLQRAEAIAPFFGLRINPTTIQMWAPNGTVSPHSIVMEFIIESGLLGVLFAFALIFLAVRFLYGSHLVQNRRVGLLATYLTGQLLWELAFSPITYGVDTLLGIALVLWTVPKPPKGQDIAHPGFK